VPWRGGDGIVELGHRASDVLSVEIKIGPVRKEGEEN